MDFIYIPFHTIAFGVKSIYPIGTVTVNPTAFKPPIHQPYAQRLNFLSTLPLNERLAFMKSNILRTGANALNFGSNSLGRAQQSLTNAANDLYTPKPAPPPVPARPTRPGTNFVSPIQANGIQPRDPKLSPG